MIYLELFWGFLKVGLFSFGGAYAAIPLIRDVVLSYGWLSDEALSYMIAVSESTPGPIMINLATFIGSRQGGIAGAALATLAVIMPAFVIILLVTAIMKKFLGNPYVASVLNGLKSCVVGIILAVGAYMALNNIIGDVFEPSADYRAIILTFVIGLILFGTKAVFKKKISPILLIVISAFLGVGIYSL